MRTFARRLWSAVREIAVGSALLLGLAIALAPIWLILSLVLTSWLGGVASLQEPPFVSEPRLYGGGVVTEVSPLMHAIIYVTQALAIAGMVVVVVWALLHHRCRDHR